MAAEFDWGCDADKIIAALESGRNNMKKQLEAAGYRVDLQYAADSVETQVSQIENMITKGARFSLLLQLTVNLWGVLEDAAKDGIKVITRPSD